MDCDVAAVNIEYTVGLAAETVAELKTKASELQIDPHFFS